MLNSLPRLKCTIQSHLGIHMTDMARHLMGEITEVYGVASEKVWKVPGSEDNAMAIFKSPTGVAATYQATWTDWKGYSSVVEVYGSHGMVRGAYAPMQTLTITMDRPGGAVRRVRNLPAPPGWPKTAPA